MEFEIDYISLGNVEPNYLRFGLIRDECGLLVKIKFASAVVFDEVLQVKKEVQWNPNHHSRR